MSVTSNFNSELNNYFTKINLEKLNTNNPLTRGTSTISAKKIGAIHKRNNSNSFFGSEANIQANLLEKNFSKINLFKEEENSNSNLNLNNLNINNNNQSLAANAATGSHPLDSYILKHKSPVLTINRKKSSVSPLQKISKNINNNNINFNGVSNNNNAFNSAYNNNFNNNNNNNNSGNNFFGNAENRKNQNNERNGIGNNNNSDNRVGNDFGTIDLKFEIKNKHFQLPNLYPENKYKKINNYRNAANSKRINNSVTPSKFIYNAQNIGNILAKKEENLNVDVNAKGIRRFNYPTATQILHNRVR